MRHDLARRLGQEVFKKSWVESGRVRRYLKCHGSARVGSGRVGSGYFQISRVGPGHPDPI